MVERKGRKRVYVRDVYVIHFLDVDTHAIRAPIAGDNTTQYRDRASPAIDQGPAELVPGVISARHDFRRLGYFCNCMEMAMVHDQLRF